MISIGEQIKSARKARGMTQDELAGIMNVSRTAIANWEADRRLPDAQTLLELSKALGYSFETGSEINVQADEPKNFSVDNSNITLDAASPLPHPKRRHLVIALSVAGAVLTAMFIVLILMLFNTGENEFKGDNGLIYRISDYKASTPYEADKAYITIDTITETMQGSNATYWMYRFVLREDNGIDFHIDRLENIWFKRDSAQVFVFSDSDLTAMDGISPDISAHAKTEFSGGMPLDQTNMVGVSLRIEGHDANGALLAFTAYIPFPQS